MMKYLLNRMIIGTLFIALLLMQSCNCAAVDCDSSISFSFNLIDAQTGKDIVFDLDVPLSEIIVKNSQNETIDIVKGDRVLWASVYLYDTNHQLNYQKKDYTLNLTYGSIKDTCCDQYKVTDITSEDVHVSVQNAIYTIKI